MIKKILSNDYLFNIINKILLVLTGLLSSAFLARYLGIGLRGEYSYVLSIVTIAALIMDLGFDQAYSYFYKKNKGGVYLDFLNIYIAQFIIMAVFLVITSSIFNYNRTFVLVCLLIPTEVLNRQFAGTMAVENIRRKIITDTSVCLAKAFFLGIIFFFKDKLGVNIFYPVLVLVILNLITCISYMIGQKKSPHLLKMNLSFLGEVIKYSWLPMLSMLMLTLNYSVDILFMKYLGTQTELGYYSIAVGIVNYMWLIPDALKEVLISRVSRSDDVSQTINALKISLYSTIGTIILFSIFGKIAIEILYGKLYYPSYGVTVVLSIGAISMTFFKVINVLFLAEGKRKLFFFTLLFSVLANMILNYLTIPFWGMYGAAISSIVSYSVCGFIFLLNFKQDKNLSFKEIFLF